MLIKSDLLLSESISDKTGLYDLLKVGKLPFRYYLLLCTENGTLEIIPALMQKSNHLISDKSVVFGLAGSKSEAEKMICDIISKVYTEHVYSSVEAFVKEILGDTVC